MITDKTICAYCGKTSFVIGASNKPNWCMVEGTGRLLARKITCPECYKKASKEGQEAIGRHMKNFNRRAKT